PPETPKPPVEGPKPPIDPPTGNQKSELDKLRGSWKMVSGQREGKALPPQEVASIGMKFNGDKVQLLDGTRGDEATVKVDASKSPAWIDLTTTREGISRSGKVQTTEVLQGIFKIEGETLTLCLGQKQRPSDLKGDAESMLFVFQRGEVTAPQPPKD